MSSGNAANPYGGADTGRVTDNSAADSGLLEHTLSLENMQEAWKRVRANKGSPGVDGITIARFPETARPHWKETRSSILGGTYVPTPVLRVEIPKRDGRLRPLGIPTVQDRLIQQAIAQVIGPIFERDFSESSFGYRPGRSAHDAVRKVREHIREGYRIAVDIDLSKFFDTVNHDALMARVARRIRDRRVLHLIGRYLRAGVVIDGRLQATREGMPQGGPLSPLLSNIMLDDLDKELEKRGYRFARYADDLTILVRSRQAGERVMQSIRRFIEKRLKLAVNVEKSRVVPTDESTFLGFTFRGTKIRWTEKAFKEFKRRIRELTGRSWFVSMDYRMRKLAEYIRGWMNYFGISEYYRPIPELDHWLRRRTRMCYWKQWRKPRKRIRELMKLGTPKHSAILAGISRKSYWRLSRTLGTHSGMTKAWLAEQGLVSIRNLWVKIHYPATARLSS